MLVLLIFLKKKKNRNKEYCLHIVYVYMFWKFSKNWWIIDITNINFNLLNGVMLIHPIILYTAYAALLINQVSVIFLKKNFNLNFKYKTTLILLIFAFFLGCYWAEQELFWGGWWSWDFVELIILGVTVYTIYMYHSIKHSKISHYIKISCKTTPLIIIISILIVRYNIINSIHNFINSNSANQYDYYLVLLVFILIALLLKKFTEPYYNPHILPIFFKIFIVYLYIIFLYNICINTFLKLGGILYTYVFIFLCYLTTFNKRVHTYTPLLVFTNFTYLHICIYTIIIYIFKSVIKARIQHVGVVLMLCFVNQQILLFSDLGVYNQTFNFKNFKLNFFYSIDTYIDLIKQKSLLLDTLENNKTIFTNIFEKNITSFSNKEIYNLNNQYLYQVGFSMLYNTTIVLLIYSALSKKIFLNKEHCYYINI